MNVKRPFFLAGGLLFMMIALACTCGGLPPLLATVTPVPTPTPEPSPTPTPLPVLVNASPGTVTEPLPDGSTRFRDLEHGYTLVLPPFWVVLPYGQAELQALAQQLAATNPDLADMAEQMQYVDPDLTRLIALDSNPAHFSGGSATNLNIGADRPSARVPLSVLIEQTANSLSQVIPGLTVLDSGFSQLSNGQQTAYVEVTLELSTSSGMVPVFERLEMFQTNSATIIVTIACGTEHREAVVAELETIMATVEVSDR